VTSLPTIGGITREGERIRVALELPAELLSFQGHFTEVPILPAVAQIDWAVALAREQFALPARFVGLRALKFLHIIQPSKDVTLELSRSPDGRTVDFEYLRGGTACSSGRIEFADDASGPDRSVL